MSGIAGIGKPQEHERVGKMLDTISYRGNMSRQILEIDGNTIGIVTSGRDKDKHDNRFQEKSVADWAGKGHNAEACIIDGKLELKRDQLGVAPLYYDIDTDGSVYFASEVKALLSLNNNAKELLPGNRLINKVAESYYTLEKQRPLTNSLLEIKYELKNRLKLAITDRIKVNSVGSWLSGGLDSSVIAALAKPHISSFNTFVTGLKGAEDIEYAREVANFIGSVHHEVIVSIDDLLNALPSVIYHLESFDALLVRSSITNYLVANVASDYVSEVFSGEGGDEFFAGYTYLKQLPTEALDDELIAISRSLHNTALQRVDRCASAHGTTAHVVFADPNVFEYALKIPIQYKLLDGVEKWILRQAMEGELPDRILKRTKSKFWEGAGISSILSDYANKNISDHDFKMERKLNNGWILNTKEELMYYRIFRECFGVLENMQWMGRTKGSPIS
jgi:asparagine synthase (glutamine-hydrolysing)